jgi:hypothetical protein
MKRLSVEIRSLRYGYDTDGSAGCGDTVRYGGSIYRPRTVSIPVLFVGFKKRKTALKAVPLQLALGASAPRLNNRSFALTNWSLALAHAANKPEGENN